MIELITELSNIDYTTESAKHLSYNNSEFLFTLKGEELAIDLFIDIYGDSNNEEDRFNTDLKVVTFGDCWDEDMNIIDLTDYQENKLRKLIKEQL